VTREADAVHDEVLAPLTAAEHNQLHDLLLRLMNRS
jgi:hypothetical protein